MSSFYYRIPIREVLLDGEMCPIEDYETNLPHKQQIADELVSDWRKSDILQYFNDDVKSKLERLDIVVIEDHTTKELYARIAVIGKLGVRFTRNLKDKIVDELDGQMSDGWGEGIFGYNNIMTAPDGTKFMIE